MLSNLLDDLIFVGKVARFQLRVDQFAVNGDFETATLGGLQIKAADLLFVGSEDFGRQTDGLRFVVSSSAVLQVDLHRVFLVQRPSLRAVARVDTSARGAS